MDVGASRRWLVSVVCCLGIVAALSPLARAQDAAPKDTAAQDAAPERKDAAPPSTASERKDPAPTAQEPAPERKDPPPTAKDGAPEPKDAPPTAQEPAPERKDPAPTAQEPAPERKDPPPTAKDGAPEPKDAPPTAQEPAPERKDPPPTAQEPAPDRKEPPAAAQDPGPARKSPPARAAKEPDRLRGVIATVDASSLVLQVAAGKTIRLALPPNLAVFSLSKASFAEVDFGKYVGAVSKRLGDQIYSPIIRDSLSWLHRGFELRIIDEDLRGIAVGHAKWDLTPDSVMTHGWVDDMEDRVISIKYGPTEEEETDVEVPRDVPILRMSRGERTLIKPGLRVFAGAQKGPDGNYVAVFIFVGKDGIVPPL
jgi:hypothetical protein